MATGRELEILTPEADGQEPPLGENMEHIISEVIEKTPSVIERVGGELPRDFPEELFGSITSGLARAARELAAQA